MPHSILVVDDDANVQTLLRDYLSEQGFLVETAPDGRQALLAARHSQPDLILLDIMMPEMDGFDFIRSYRREHNAPVILLTARVGETDKVVGLELGADDYVTKPFSMRELVARIRAIIRRSRADDEITPVLHVGEVILDQSRRLVRVGDKSVNLTPTEFELLVTLMAVPGRVFSRQQLLEKLHGLDLEGSGRTIDVHIRNLRSKLEPDPPNPRYIETVFGVGYRFAAG